MGSEAEKEWSYTPKLALFSSPQAHMQSPERSGTLTPPLQASAASVPFRWEEEPGKPKPCATLTIFSNPNDLARKCLELPPRLLHDAGKTPTPKGARFQSPSFRMGSECYGSFRGDSRSLGTVVRSRSGAYKAKGFVGCWRRRLLKGRRDVGGSGNSYVFPSSGDRDSEWSNEEESNSSTTTRIKRVGALHFKSKFWATIYRGFKLSVPWSKREKKDGFTG
ncbi:maternal effect embryo arrest 47 [Hibiscus trionum]|uniref:Maternal effect embryo arrest 47 n=1 Tax=Hibiscus trionum TaxID=183268 RepID=A0A9W7H9X9_HIBTR|nr:maternal effect embryo arrest 47 [Hibiscus trionum]